MLPLESRPPRADAANRTRVSSLPGTRSATELRRLEALIGFEPMTCSFGESRARPLRYRAESWGDRRRSKSHHTGFTVQRSSS